MGSGTITADGTEQTVLLPTLSSDAYLSLRIDLANMAAGDVTTIRVYEKIDGTNYRKRGEYIFRDAQAYPVFAINQEWTDATMLMKTTLQQSAGTNRTYPWRSRTQV